MVSAALSEPPVLVVFGRSFESSPAEASVEPTAAKAMAIIKVGLATLPPKREGPRRGNFVTLDAGREK